MKKGTTFNLSGKSWTPIGNDRFECFAGTFDGNSSTGTSITGMTITWDNTAKSFGLFGYVLGYMDADKAKNAKPTVKNVTVTNAYIQGTLNTGYAVGGIVGELKGQKVDATSQSSVYATVENCSFAGTMNVDKQEKNAGSETYVGGIVGVSGNGYYSSVKNCTNNAIINATAFTLGGVVGKLGSSSGANPGVNESTIEQCINKGNIYLKDNDSLHFAGGIVGQAFGKVSDCTNAGTIDGTSGSIGGIVGQIGGNFSVENCKNTAAITCEGKYVGGIAGQAYPDFGDAPTVTIKKCFNTGALTTTDNGSNQYYAATGGVLGGIAVRDKNNENNCIKLEECYNEGAVAVNASSINVRAGGLIGYDDEPNTKIEMSQCYNAGAVTANTSTGGDELSGVIGGLIGSVRDDNSIIFTNCYNVGAITAQAQSNVYIGGLIGTLSYGSINKGTISLSSCYNAGVLTGGQVVGGILGYNGDNSLLTLTNCSYLYGNGTGVGTPKSANEMTEDNLWSKNLGLSTDIWEKDDNPIETVDGKLIGHLPVLQSLKPETRPQLERSEKETQEPLSINGLPTGEIYTGYEDFTLIAQGGSGNGAVTWSSSDEKVATVDNNGKVHIVDVGSVTITANKDGDNTYDPTSASVSFSVNGQTISEVTIRGLNAPVNGETPEGNVSVPDGVPYEILTPVSMDGAVLDVVWLKDGEALSAENSFTTGDTYTAQIRLKAASRYTLADDIQVQLEGINYDVVIASVTAKKDSPAYNNLIITVTFKPTTEHIHNWSDDWSGDATHHWYACKNKDCPMIGKDYALHTDNGDGVCSVCGQTIGYTITFNANGGSCATESARTTLAGTLSTLLTPTREGYTFRGWFTAANGGTQVTTETVFDADTTIYAQWEKIPDPPYTGSYNYPVTITDTDNGSVLLDKADEWVTGGETVTFSVAPDEAYLLESLTITDKNGKEITVKDNGDGTYTFTMPESAVTITATFAEDPDWEPTPEPGDAWPFVDVSEGDWFYDPVAWAYEQGLMTGTSATTFEPNVSTTRGMIVAILHRLEDSPVVNYLMTFDDVADGDWYAEAVRWAASEGIVAGYSDAQFGPNDPITREQMAAILYNYAEWKGYDVSARADLSGYSDQPSVWAVEVMQWAKAEGLINGTTATTLDPQGHATRAQVAAILQRFLEN